MNALLILNFNSHSLIESLIIEVQKFDSIKYIVIVDNDSTEASKKKMLDIEKNLKR